MKSLSYKLVIVAMCLVVPSLSCAWSLPLKNKTPLDGTFKVVYNICRDDTTVVAKKTTVNVNAYGCFVTSIQGNLWDPNTKQLIPLQPWHSSASIGKRDFRVRIYDSTARNKSTTPNYVPKYVIEVLDKD